MKSIISLVTLSLCLPLAAQAGSDHHHDDHGHDDQHHHQQMESHHSMAEGMVKKVDAEKRRIKIKHGPLTALNMPPMTMTFEVADGVDLSSVQAGEEIEFTVEKVDGKFTVTAIDD